MEALVITAIITGLSGLSVAVFTHLKHSECCRGFCEFTTRTPPQSVGNHESTTISQAPTPSQLRKTVDVDV